MKVLISHPHGNKNTKKVVNILGKLNLLDTFWTTIAFPFKFNIIKFFLKYLESKRECNSGPKSI